MPNEVTLIVGGRQIPFILVPASMALCCGLFWWFGYWEGIVRKRSQEEKDKCQKIMDQFKGF